MQHTFDEVQQFASELPADQRILLANSLWESADASDGEAASEAEIEADLRACSPTLR